MPSIFPAPTRLPRGKQLRTWLPAGARGLLLLGGLAATSCSGDNPGYVPPLPSDDLGPGMLPGNNGLPCAVAKLLSDRCLSCHGQPPTAAPMALVSYADLTARSTFDPTVRV